MSKTYNKKSTLKATAEFISWDEKNNCPIILVFENTQSHRDYKKKVLEHLKYKIPLKSPPPKKRFFREPLKINEEQKEKLESAEKVLSLMILPSLPIEFPKNDTPNITISQKTFKLNDEGCEDIALITAILIVSPKKQ